MPQRLDRTSPGFEAAFQRLLDAKHAPGEDVRATVKGILADVRARGDAALVAYTERFDGVTLAPDAFRVTPAEFAAAERAVGPDLRCALEFAALRIEDYHRRQLPEDLDYRDEAGVRLGYRWRPLAAVGVYVPGGTAVYPSSVLMNAIPARIAGVKRIAMTVPTPKGVLNPLLLVAAKIAGVTEIYRLGGAQAIAALAYGTENVCAVDKIVGPGNVYVAEAKRQVFGQVGIDMIAGPSEILILADGANDPAWIAADLLSQAEHDPAAQAILMTDDREFAAKVEAAIEDALQSLERAEIARTSWEANGVIVFLDRLEDAIPLIDRLAPEHLELAIEDADAFAALVRNAGAIFIGRFTPEALGDYVAGPNHVLPTARSARFSSGLGVLDFLKRTSFVACGEAALDRLAPAAEVLATAEGLDAHARSLRLRMSRPKGG
ncbi:MAG: histidinol dehydrogenase [Rhodospirillaceae bacterium]|nr:MAG: histidinol dehydrogenase [Rhodospirillaceae bacterium]